MLRRYPDTLRWRQALPPLFVASLIGLALLTWWPPAAMILALELAIYGTVIFMAGFLSVLRHRKLYLFVGLPLAIATMHLAWGSGFLWSVTSTLEYRKNG